MTPPLPSKETILLALDAVDARLTFNERNHTYRLDGQHLPGVTTILNQWDRPQLDSWRVRVQQEADIETAWRIFSETLLIPGADREQFAATFKAAAGEEYEHQKQSREAKDLGSQVHALIERHVKARLGVPFEIDRPISDEAQELFTGWLAWEKGTDFEPLFVERRVFSDDPRYCGTIDLGALVAGEPSVFDWKTKRGTGRPYPDQILQNVAYRRALRSMGLGEWTGHLVQLPKDGGAVTAVHVEPGPDDKWTVEGAFESFEACLRLYRAAREFA